jgi:hypothetical protein
MAQELAEASGCPYVPGSSMSAVQTGASLVTSSELVNELGSNVANRVRPLRKPSTKFPIGWVGALDSFT